MSTKRVISRGKLCSTLMTPSKPTQQATTTKPISAETQPKDFSEGTTEPFVNGNLSQDHPLMVILNRVITKEITPQKKQFNNLRLQEILKLLNNENSFMPNEIHAFANQFVLKMTSNVTLFNVSFKNEHKVTYMENQVANDKIVAKVYRKLIILGVKELADKPIGKRLAIRTLYMAYLYNFKASLKIRPELQLAITRPFAFLVPSNTMKPKEMLKLYRAIHGLKITVPTSWHLPSMNWFKANLDKLKITSVAELYNQLLNAGLPPSLDIEHYIYDYVFVNKATLDIRFTYNIMENLARALLAPSVGSFKNNLKIHYLNFDFALRQISISPEHSFIIRLTYANAYYRLNLFERKDLNFLTETYEDLSQKQTDLELKLKVALKAVFPNKIFKSEIRIANFLPPVDYLEPNEKWIVEADGFRHDSLILKIHRNNEVVLIVTPQRPLDIITRDISEALGYQHFRANHRLIKNRGAIQRELSKAFNDKSD